MFARLSAKIVLLTIAVALVFFGVGLVGLGIAAALAPLVGPAWADAIAGLIFVLPALIWALAVVATRPAARPAANPGARQFTNAILAALAKETPWIAVVGTGLAGLAQMFLNRKKSEK